MMTSAVWDAPAATMSVHPDMRVLAERPLRDGIELTATSRYADEVWDLTPALLQKQLRSLTLDFTTIEAGFREAAREYLYAQLAVILPEAQRRRRIATLRVDFSRLKIFTDWLAANEIPTLSAVAAQDLAAFRRDQIARGISAGWRAGLSNTIRSLWLFRDQMPADHLGFDPATLEGWYEQAGARRTENATGRIPEAVLGPLLGWALRYIEEFTTDIFAARVEWARLFARNWNRRSSARGAGEKAAVPALRTVLDRYRQAGLPLPSSTRFGGVNVSHLAREADVGRYTVSTSKVGRELVCRAVAELGIDDAYLWTPMTARVGERLWLERMPHDQYRFYEQCLMASCYIVISFLSGMRDSEVKHLRRGALSVTTTGGRLPRYTLTSQAFKGEASDHGTTARWVVGAPVAGAIEILERLQPAEQEMLFAPLRTAGQHNQRRLGKAHANAVLSSKATNDDIAGLIEWINSTCAALELPDTVPHVAGARPKVLSSQFRRTLAWFIARRPGGSIAGAIAYRHHSVQMFEGYAGTSASGFRAEVEAEKALERGEHLALMVERHEHHHMTGPAAAEARARVEEFGHQAGFAGTVSTDRRQMLKLMARHDPHVYPGALVTCVHNPDRALCTGGMKAPSLIDCQPLACRNAAFSAENTTAWRNQLAAIDRELAGAVHPPYLAHRLLERRGQISRIVESERGDGAR